MKSQFFADCTYNVVPYINKNFKLYVLNAFNTIENKTELCALILISNENIETYVNIYEYLINKYKFNPTKLTVDCQKSHILAILKLFPNCCLIICYFHIIRRLVIHLPEIRSKNLEKKEMVKNLLANMKILLFIPQTDIINYFELIREKYYSKFPKFIKYFYKNFFIAFPMNKLIWNYYYYANLFYNDNQLLFFININYFIKNNNINKLIIFKDLIKIYEDYARYLSAEALLKNKELFLEEEKIFDNDINNKSEYNSYEPDFNSESSVDSDEEVVFSYNRFNNNQNNDNNDGQEKGDIDYKNNKNDNNSRKYTKNKKSKNCQNINIKIYVVGNFFLL